MPLDSKCFVKQKQKSPKSKQNSFEQNFVFLEDDDERKVDFNGRTMTVTSLLTEKYDLNQLWKVQWFFI